LVLPTFAATAWYHGRFWPEKPLSEVVDYARRFAYDDYAPAMAQPNRMDRYTKERFFKELAELTGLPETTIRKYNGRINEEIFTTEFFSPERKILGGLDTRYVGDQSSIKRWSTEEDPSYREELRGLMPTFIHYLQTELEGGCGHLSYVPFSRQPWFFNVMDLMEWLRRALVINPDLQVFSANGYYDCRTPFLAAEYCIDHLDLPESYANNIEFKYYEAGHGLIFDADALQQLQTDLVGFYAK
jgi:carboxypeptidase C (cathepsin A)